MAMQPPIGPQKSRTMAAVSPLHQVVPSQANLSPYEAAGGLGTFGPPSQRTSSFAAALRKLAKQAGDPIVGEKDLTQISPVSSPALAQRSLTPKRNGQGLGQSQSMYHQVSNGSFQSSSASPPVVTIAPSRSHATHTTDSRKLQVMDLGNLTQPNSTAGSVTNGHLSDPLGLGKLDGAGSSTSNKQGSRSVSNEKWDEHATSKSLSTSTGTSQSRPHATIAPLPRPDDSLASSRGFQPYRSADDLRTSLPHHISSPFEHHPPAAYPYTPAFLPPPHLPHPAYRLDDALFLDRYGLLRSPVMQFPGQPGMMSPAAFYPQSRYDLLAQSLSLSSANNSLLHHERLKLEEEQRRQREKEVELDQSRKREMERREKEHKDREKEKESKERDKEKERREKSHRDKGDHSEHKASNHSISTHSKRTEYSASRSEPVPQTAGNHSSQQINSSTPLNLVVHPNNNANDHPKKDTELWLPWQQHPPSSNNHNSKETSHDEGTKNLPTPYKMPTTLPQENSRLPTSLKENNGQAEKYTPYNMQYFADKKHIPEDIVNDSDPKRHMPPHHVNINNRKYDSLHHHLAELSKKDAANNEWKHEKLQKACTNNHRKNVNDVKKMREESHHHQYGPLTIPAVTPASTATTAAHLTSHHRKHLNGTIKPMLSQDEGMHARLLETEKCRIEYNNMISAKTQHTDKLQVANLIQSAQLNGKELNSSLMYMDYSHQSMPLYKQQTVEAPPLKSKLDKEAEDLANGRTTTTTEISVTSTKDFLILSKGPTLPSNTNPLKMQYLKLLGLTSRLKRKKIELDIYLKRRKIHLEDPYDEQSVDFVTVEEKKSPLFESYQNLEFLSEKLRLKRNPDKTEFLRSLSLCSLSLGQKEENTRILRVTEDERKRRFLRVTTKAQSKTLPPALVPEVKKETDVKTEDNHCSDLKLANMSDSSQSSQNVANQGDQVPYVQKDQPNRALTSIGSWEAIPSTSKIRTKYSFKRGHSLKCEWNSSAPSTSSQNNHHLTNGSLEVKTEKYSSTHISTGVQADLIASLNNICSKKQGKSKNFNWPGLEAIIEAYYRHNKEQLVEQELLRKKCNQLKVKQEELKHEAKTVSKSMSELLNLKRELEEKRGQTEQSIEMLKKLFHAAR